MNILRNGPAVQASKTLEDIKSKTASIITLGYITAHQFDGSVFGATVKAMLTTPDMHPQTYRIALVVRETPSHVIEHESYRHTLDTVAHYFDITVSHWSELEHKARALVADLLRVPLESVREIEDEEIPF